MTKRPFSAFAALLLSACAGVQDGRGYPSLAKRPIEAGGGGVPAPGPKASEVAQAPDAAFLRRVSELAQNVGDGDAGFNNIYNEAAGRIRVATSAPVSSENWVAAHVMLGELEQARYPSALAMAELDTLYAERMKAIADGKASGGIPEIDAERKIALAIIDGQNDRIDALRAVLKEP